VRGSLSKRVADDLKHSRDVRQDIIVPESHNTIVAVGEPLVSDGIMSTVRMLSAIHLDDEALFATDEVYRVGSDRLLPNDFESI